MTNERKGVPHADAEQLEASLQPKMGVKIVTTAMQGFLRHGYHGYSVEALGSELALSKSAMYYYFETKSCLAIAAMDTIELRFYEISFSEDAYDLYKLEDGEMVALLPMILLESGIRTIRRRVFAYYERWRLYFLSRKCQANALDEPAPRQAFWAWLGYWMMVHAGVNSPADFADEEVDDG